MASPFITEFDGPLGAEDFQNTVLAAGCAVVDFYSDECPPCEVLATKFEPLSELYGAQVKFVKIFRQKNRELATSLGVTGSPTLLFFKDGQRVGEALAGGVQRSAIQKNLDTLISPDAAKAIRASVKPVETEADVVILGGGPAGLTAGIYLAQAHLKTIIVDMALPGGYVSTTHQVSNYPGFVAPLNGYMLSHHMVEQAKANGVQFRSAVEIDEVDVETKSLRVDGYETIQAKKLIIATGSKPKELGVPGELAYQGHGISYCATCDAKYYNDKDVVVIGGGNSAVEESLFIAKFARSVTIIHRSSHLRANKEAIAQIHAEPKIRLLLDHEVTEITKAAAFDMGVVVKNNATGETTTVATHGVFIFIGFIPNTEHFCKCLETDKWGYITADAHMRTNLPGVFSAGDVNAKTYRQITTAVSDGTIAAIGVTKELH